MFTELMASGSGGGFQKIGEQVFSVPNGSPITLNLKVSDARIIVVYEVTNSSGTTPKNSAAGFVIFDESRNIISRCDYTGRYVIDVTGEYIKNTSSSYYGAGTYYKCEIYA